MATKCSSDTWNRQLAKIWSIWAKRWVVGTFRFAFDLSELINWSKVTLEQKFIYLSSKLFVSLSFHSISVLAEVIREGASLKFKTFPFNLGQHLDLEFRYTDLYFILVCKGTKDLSNVCNEYKCCRLQNMSPVIINTTKLNFLSKGKMLPGTYSNPMISPVNTQLDRTLSVDWL